MNAQGGKDLKDMVDQLSAVIKDLHIGTVLTKGKANRIEYTIKDICGRLTNLAPQIEELVRWRGILLTNLVYVLPEGQFSDPERSDAYAVIRDYLIEERNDRRYSDDFGIDAETKRRFSLLFDGPMVNHDPVNFKWNPGYGFPSRTRLYLNFYDEDRSSDAADAMSLYLNPIKLEGRKANYAIIDKIFPNPPVTKGFVP